MADLDKKFYTASIRGNIPSGANYLVVRAYVRGAGITVSLAANGTYITGGETYLNYSLTVSGTNGNPVNPFREVSLPNTALTDHPNYNSPGINHDKVYINQNLPLVAKDPGDNVYSNP